MCRKRVAGRKRGVIKELDDDRWRKGQTDRQAGIKERDEKRKVTGEKRWNNGPKKKKKKKQNKREVAGHGSVN